MQKLDITVQKLRIIAQGKLENTTIITKSQKKEKTTLKVFAASEWSLLVLVAKHLIWIRLSG